MAYNPYGPPSGAGGYQAYQPGPPAAVGAPYAPHAPVARPPQPQPQPYGYGAPGQDPLWPLFQHTAGADGRIDAIELKQVRRHNTPSLRTFSSPPGGGTLPVVTLEARVGGSVVGYFPHARKFLLGSLLVRFHLFSRRSKKKNDSVLGSFQVLAATGLGSYPRFARQSGYLPGSPTSANDRGFFLWCQQIPKKPPRQWGIFRYDFIV